MVSDEYKVKFFDEHMPNYECNKPACWYCEMTGVKKEHIKPTYPTPKFLQRFSNVEDSLIIKMYRYNTAKEVAKQLGRPPQSLRKRIKYLRDLGILTTKKR